MYTIRKDSAYLAWVSLMIESPAITNEANSKRIIMMVFYCVEIYFLSN